MARGVWMLKVDVGTVWRFASQAVDYDGYRWHDGLDSVDGFAQTLSMSVPEERAAQLVIHYSQVEGFPAESVAMGATGTLYYWHDSEGADDPEAVVVGRLEEPVYGSAGVPMTATLREVPWDDRGRIVGRLAKIDDVTWPDFDDDAGIEEEWYPIVFGSPSAGAPLIGSPAYQVDTTGTPYVMIAGHPVVASTVLIYNPDTGNSSPAQTVVEIADGRGQTVAAIDATLVTVGTRPYVNWNGGGGLPSLDDSSVAMTGAGDLIEWLLHRSTLRIDWGRMRAVRQRLNAFRFDGYIQPQPGGRLSPWEWIASEALPLLPVEVRQSSRGLYLAIFDPTAPTVDVPVSLVTGENCDRVSDVTAIGTASVANDLTLSFAPFADSDKGSTISRVSGDPSALDTNTDPNGAPFILLEPAAKVIPSALCAESFRRFGPAPKEMTTSIVYDRATAEKILLAMAARTALPSLEVALIVDDDPELRALEPGDSVLVTDAGLGWSDRLAYVWQVNIAQAREIVLRIWPGN